MNERSQDAREGVDPGEDTDGAPTVDHAPDSATEGGTWDLRRGTWRTKLVDVECDSLITDPPYGPRTHLGYRTARDGDEGSIARRTGIMRYAPLRPVDVKALADWADVHVRRWVVLFGDDVTAQWWKAAFEKRGWYTFRPLPWIKRGACPRFTGDGPSSDSESIVVARRTGIRDGAKPGHYITGRVEGATNGSLIVGQKPLALMCALVRDYSRPGDVIVDPHAGSGTTLLAATIEGRRCIGAERDPETHALAMRRLAKGHTPSMFAAPDADTGNKETAWQLELTR